MSDDTTGLEANLKSRKAELELERLRIDNDRARLELRAFGRPTKWEIAKSLVAFFGIVIPALGTVFTFLHQRGIEIEQREKELKAERVRAIEKAQQLRANGDVIPAILQLSIIGEEAIPFLLAEIRVTWDWDDTNRSQWPDSTVAAIGALRRVGVQHLSDGDVGFLQSQVQFCINEIRSYMPRATKNDAPTDDFLNRKRLLIAKELSALLPQNKTWADEIRNAEAGFAAFDASVSTAGGSDDHS